MQKKEQIKVVIQGVPGAFHEIAARHYFKNKEVDVIPALSFNGLIEKAENKAVSDYAIMAIENTIAGSLLQNYILLKDSKHTVVGEVLLRIKHNLLAIEGTDINDINEVHSHPMAILQCREFFQQHPHIRLVEADDTAASAKRVKKIGNPKRAAIASALAAEKIGLEILASEIETNHRNYTRFLVLERKNNHDYKKHHVKVSVSFALEHQVGSLSTVLNNLSRNNTNLTKIQSMPIIGKEWQYYFFVDFIINGLGIFEDIIADLRNDTAEFKILGTYEKGITMIVKEAKRLSQVKEYYFSHKLREVAQMNADGKDVINLGIGKPDLPPPPSAIESLHRASRLPDNHGYQSYTGIAELREAFVNWYARFYNVDLNPSKEILPLIGSKEGIMHITMSYLEEGDEVLVPNPGYPAYSSAANLSGAKSILYNLTEENGWLPNFSELERLDLSRVKLMWINYPHMPTGARASRSVMEKLVKFCLKNNILLCHDNPYSFILNDKPFSIFEIEGAKDCALELNSLSKSHNMSGWRVGMLAGDQAYIKTILKFKSNMDSGMFKALQEGAIAALKEGTEWFENLTKSYTERKLAAEKIIDLLDCEYRDGQSGMFLWAKINEKYDDAKQLADEILYGANVFITPGNIFGSNGNRYIRISLCQPKEFIEQARIRIEKFKSGE